MDDFLDLCRRAIGAEFVLTEQTELLPYVAEWRQRYSGKALAVLRPASTAEVAALVRLCARHHVPIVPQGGNTGLVLGSVPDQSGKAVVISLKRMNRIRAIDGANNTVTAEAGCLLAQVQHAADVAGRLYPLSLASEGSCTVGGNLSTNAGGTAVLRYGNARDLCLGLEVVTANGEIWHGLRGLRKDNTGYDLRDLFIGAEGTLGIITAAVLKLYPRPKAQITAFAAVATPQAALALLNFAQAEFGPALTGFELISDFCLQLVLKHIPHLAPVFDVSYPYYVLLELSDHESEQHGMQRLEATLGQALEQGQILNAAIAASLSQSESMWDLRENISLAQAAEGKNIKHDISLPVSAIPEFMAATEQLLQQNFPGCRLVCFGHMGDGNLHYNISPPANISDTEFLTQQTAINRVAHDSVHHFGGSISAEHGLGALKRDEIRRYKTELEMRMMQTLKSALDPQNLMNPGKIF